MRKNVTSAIVVGYHPELLILNNLLLGLLGQVDFVVFADNGGGRDYLNHAPEQKSRVVYIDLRGNQGLGFALNEGFKRAMEKESDFVALFDQDSVVTPSLIAELRERHVKLRGLGIQCAAVAPVFFDRREEKRRKFPFYREINGKICSVSKSHIDGGLIEVDVLITSGMLVNAEAWTSGVKFDPDLFVDYTDTDWCFRSRAAGYKLFACLDQEMGHAPSDAPPARILGLSFFRYSPVRRYYYFRNTIYFLRQSYVSWAWKKRLSFGLALRLFTNVFIDQEKLSSIGMMVIGMYHGLVGKRGPYK